MHELSEAEGGISGETLGETISHMVFDWMDGKPSVPHIEDLIDYLMDTKEELMKEMR